MSLVRLELHDFRAFEQATFLPSPEGTTVVVGPNGTGKTTLLEATAYLGTGRSFRGSPREAMVRAGCERAIVRAELRTATRDVLVEAELPALGRARARTQINRQPARTRRALAEATPVTVFAPGDLALIQGGPGGRRELLDDALGLLDAVAAARVEEVERILRQRAALLRQSGGRLSADVETTLEVWDARLAQAGSALADSREVVVETLRPYLASSYDALAGGDGGGGEGGGAIASLEYRRSWEGTLAEALAARRREDLRRGTTGCGPHRDDVVVDLSGRDARTQASQGEQRCLALAVRLGVHRLVTERHERAPILLLDDVFSELDPDRSRALVRELPDGQAILTTATSPPAGVSVAALVNIADVYTEQCRDDGTKGST